MKNLLVILPLLLLTIVCSSQTNQVCKTATNVEQAVEIFDNLKTSIARDTTNFKNDSMLLIYEERIRKLQEKFNSKKPE